MIDAQSSDFSALDGPLYYELEEGNTTCTIGASSSLTSPHGHPLYFGLKVPLSHHLTSAEKVRHATNIAAAGNLL